ncbi:hypothetical protein HPB51_013422 [Rhipicephalus microplus]|uniref:Uncharacterized protein n=1 Tax=Rhipicephalus microplus TaxID=6941 RepID=A0A9J6D592_RHIMP|nr:hypothetical protein HPB51_013422 [Rhipicephalus microplus]
MMRGRYLGLHILSFPLRQLAEVSVRRRCLRTSVNERYVTRPTTDVGVGSIVVSARWLGFLQPQPSRQQAPGESCGWCRAGQTLRREPSRNAALATGQPQLYRAHRSSFFQRLGEEPTLAAVGPGSSLRGSMADAADLSLFGRSFLFSPLLTTTVTWNSLRFSFAILHLGGVVFFPGFENLSLGVRLFAREERGSRVEEWELPRHRLPRLLTARLFAGRAPLLPATTSSSRKGLRASVRGSSRRYARLSVCVPSSDSVSRNSSGFAWRR